MYINLRFGMHRDIPLIHLDADKFDGLVIPAHILAYQSAPTSVFVASMPNHDYIIDPMTFILQHPGEVRLSTQKMCEEYHEDLDGTIASLGIDDIIMPDDFPVCHDFCEGVINFQLNAVREKSTASKAAKYIARYVGQTHTEPRLVLAPYFKFDSVGDIWYRFSLQCALECQQIYDADSLGVVVFCSSNSLSVEGINQIGTDYSPFSNVIIWLDDFNELAISEINIAQARRLIRILSEGGSAVETLYGGYLMMLMRQEGLRGVSHGILYTQHKAFAALPGSGGAPERYYIPEFRAFRSLSQTDLILHQHPELICSCNICADVMQGNPDRIILFGDEPDLLRRHFMAVRREESQSVDVNSRENEIENLRAAYRTYNDSIRRLPNPDAFVSHGRMRGLDYLNIWAQGLEANLS